MIRFITRSAGTILISITRCVPVDIVKGYCRHTASHRRGLHSTVSLEGHRETKSSRDYFSLRRLGFPPSHTTFTVIIQYSKHDRTYVSPTKHTWSTPRIKPDWVCTFSIKKIGMVVIKKIAPITTSCKDTEALTLRLRDVRDLFLPHQQGLNVLNTPDRGCTMHSRSYREHFRR